MSRTQQGKQREPSVKTLRFPLSAKFWRHCVFSGGTQRRAFASTPERRNENININKYFFSSSGDRTHNQSILQSHFVPRRHDYTYNKFITDGCPYTEDIWEHQIELCVIIKLYQNFNTKSVWNKILNIFFTDFNAVVTIRCYSAIHLTFHIKYRKY